MAKRKRKSKGKRRTKAKTEIKEEVKAPEPEVEEAAKAEEPQAGEAEEGEEPKEEPIKLFNRWSFSRIEIRDPGLGRYLNLEPVIIPHTAGRLSNRPFGKSRINIVERLVNKCMRSGAGNRKIGGKYIRNKYSCGKKEKVIREVERAFEIVEKRTKANPIQVLVGAIENCAPREETTSISYGGISYQKAVDVSPQRRVDLALRNVARGTLAASFKQKRTFNQALADELILAANNDPKSHAVGRKEETERVAMSAR
jgi:small subunit ribosomal protein S7